jgi:hypothetical protein
MCRQVADWHFENEINRFVMKNYMVDAQLENYLEEELLTLITNQRMVVTRLMEKGLVIGYSLSQDRSKLWIIIHANSEKQVRELLRKMPLYRYMNAVTYELAFSETPVAGIPQPSLN